MIVEHLHSGSRSTGIRQVRLSLLGCGTVGAAFAALVNASRARLRQEHRIDLILTSVLVRDPSRPRNSLGSNVLLTGRFDDIVAARPDVVVECLGGREPACRYVRRLLMTGVSVVTSNKTLIAHHGPALQAIARWRSARLAFEACVGAAVPVIAALRQRRGDPLVSLRAVVNGTCNFILSRMRESGQPLAAVLDEAIARGLAEPDPSADITGRDSAEKVCVLAQSLGFDDLTPADVATAGIERITPRDLDAARAHGCVVRLVAEIAVLAEGIRASVSPMLVPITHPLAKARGAENVFVIEQGASGQLTMQGEGAGPGPTAAAILGDVLGLLETPEATPCRVPVTAINKGASNRRCYIRMGRASAGASHLVSAASEVHLTRDTIEAVVQGGVVLQPQPSFTAPLLM